MSKGRTESRGLVEGLYHGPDKRVVLAGRDGGGEAEALGDTPLEWS